MRKCAPSISSFCYTIFIYKSSARDVRYYTKTYFLHMAHTDPSFLLRRSIAVKLFTHTPRTHGCQLSYTRILLPQGRATTYHLANSSPVWKVLKMLRIDLMLELCWRIIYSLSILAAH